MAKAVHAFQLTEEYNAIFFGWYFKGFELLRRYLVKHSSETDLKDLEFEAIDQQIEADEAAQAVPSAGKDPPVPEKGGIDAPKAQFLRFITFFFFFGCLAFLGLLINL